MLTVVSDIHMTDRETGEAVTDEDLATFVRRLTELKPRPQRLTLLLLGDVIDFLRSEQWDRLWEEHEGAAPWSSLGRDFEGFEGSLQEERLLAIQTGVEGRYPAFAAALGALKKAGDTRIRYVAGNHDFMLQVSKALRERVTQFLSLDEDPSRPFPVEYEDPELSVFAEHGHRYDKSNCHLSRQGRWALGDAIVLRVVNRFGSLARRKLHLTDKTPLGRAVHEIDNVEPHWHIPLYVMWLAETKLASATDRKKLIECWRQTVTEFLELDEFREERYGKFADAMGWLRTLYTLVDVDRISAHLRNLPVAISGRDAQDAHLVKTDADLRVFGHTHLPGVHALPEAAGRRRFYANTGTWRRVISTVRVDKGLVDFAGRRVSSFLTVRARGEFELSSSCRIP